jgi:hypothetical protein
MGGRSPVEETITIFVIDGNPEGAYRMPLSSIQLPYGLCVERELVTVTTPAPQRGEHPDPPCLLRQLLVERPLETNLAFWQ